MAGIELKACPSCGAMAPPLVATCAFCGASLPEATTPPPAPPAAGPTSTRVTGAPPRSAAWAPPPSPPSPAPPPPGSGSGPSTAWAPPPAGPEFVAAGAAPPSPRTPARTWLIIGLVATVVVIVVLGVTVAVGMDAVSDLERNALDGKGTWQTFTDPGGAFQIDLPATPTAGPVDRDDSVTSRSYTATVGRAQFTVQTHDIDGWATVGVGGEQLLALMPELMVEQLGGTSNDPIRTTAGGLPAVQFDIDAGDQQWSITAVLTGGRVIFLAAGGPAVAVGAHDRMVGSFVPFDPE